jgi:hypothetical protein
MPRSAKALAANSRAPVPWGRLKGTDPAILPQRRGSFIRHAMMKKNRPTHARVMALSRPCQELAQNVCSFEQAKIDQRRDGRFAATKQLRSRPVHVLASKS